MLAAALMALSSPLSLPQTPAPTISELPVRGLHLQEPNSAGLPTFTKFVREELPKNDINTLVVEFDYGYQFKTHPECAQPGALSEAQVKEIVAACRDAHVRLIPQINLLGHQSWAANTGQLLKAHPEFDETRGKYPGNKGIYCRSYCPLAPGLHKVVFDLIDELANACESDAFHCGMDEVKILADPDCPHCHGKKTADLFAGEVTALHDHLKATGRQMWMWGDRFIDGTDTGIGDWEGSGNNTQDAILKVPKDIVICDWHYDRAEPTAAYFALHGLQVVSCPWRRPNVVKEQLAQIRTLRKDASPETGRRGLGVMETTWMDCGNFFRAYYGDPTVSRDAQQAAATFKAMVSAFKEG